MASLDRNLGVEREAPEVGYISDPRFSPVLKANDRERKSRLSLIDLEDDTKSKNNISYSLDKPLPLEKLCKPSGAPSLDVPPTPPKRGAAFMNNKGAIKKQPIPHPTPILKLPPMMLQKKQSQFQDKRQPLPPLPQQKSTSSLPVQANEGPSTTKENIIVPNLSEKKPLTPVKEPVAVHPPQKTFRLPLPVKKSDTLPIQNAPVLPPRKGNTFPLPRKENAFKLPTTTRDSSKPLDNKDHFPRSLSKKLNSSLSKSNLKIPSFKDDQFKDTLKTLLSLKEHDSKPQAISTDEEFDSKKDGFTFSQLKETKFKMLQGKHDNSIKENQQPFSPTRHQSRFSSFFNHNDTESRPNTPMKDLLSSTKEEEAQQSQVNNDIKSLPSRNNNNEATALEEMGRTVYKGNNTTIKVGISSSLSLVNKSEDIGPVTLKKNAFDRKQKLPVGNISPRQATPIKEPVVKSNVQASTPKKEDMTKNLNQDSSDNMPNTPESNTVKGNSEFKPPLPKRKPLKAEMAILESPKRTLPLHNDSLKTASTTYSKNEDSVLLFSKSDTSRKKSIKNSLKLGLQTNDMRKSGSKEKLPKPTSIVNDIMPLNSEKESSNIPSNDGSLKKKERDIKQATPQDTSITDASNKPTDDDNVWISSPKKISPKSHLSKTTFGSHQIKPHVPHREPPIPSPRGDRVKKLVSSMEARAPPTPPKIPKPLQESASSNNMTGPPTTPKKDIVYSSNQSLSLAKTSDWRRRLDKPPPPPPLIINRDRFSHSKAAIPSAISLRKQEIPEENHHFKAPVPQSNINDNDGTASQKPNSPLLVTTIENDPHHDEVPTPGGIKSNLPVLPKLPPKTFLPDIAPPPPPKKNILPPPVVPYNLARHKKLIPIPEPVRLSLEEDYPNRTLEPTDVFHVEYRERTHFRGVQWCFDEYSGIYHKKIPGLHQTLPHFQNTDGNTTLLSRSQSTMMQPPRKLRRSKLSLSMHNEPIYSPSMDSVKWSTPTSVREVRLMRKESKKLRDKKAQLSLCRVLIEATADVKEFNPMTPHFTTKYSPRDLRKKKKKDMVFDEVLVLEAQRLLKGLVTGRDFPDAEAQFLLANCYGMGGLGFPLDRERAFRLYIHASKQNHVESIYRAAVCYELGIGTNQDNSRALSFYRKAATYSHVGSMYKLGIILLRGYCGQSKSIREALSWLQRAAACSSENPHALHALAMLQLEEGCPDTNLIADAAYAIDLLHAAARLDYVPSQIKLGELYEAGRWVEEDDAQSIYWYTKAAQAGNPDAALALSCWYLTGSCGILEQSDQEALLWAYKAATSKVADRWTVAKALFLVGIYIENGATSSREDATPWFRRAAALGHKGAADKMKGKNVKAICYTE